MNVQWSRRRFERPLALLCAVGLTTVARSSSAQTQSAAGITVGAAGVGTKGEFWQEPAFHLGAKADVIFARESPRDIGIGPYLEAGTVGFEAFDVGAGASLVLPALDDFPIVVSAGGVGHIADGQVHPLISSSLFWGSRSHNYHGHYGMAAGVLVSFRQGVTDPERTELIGALQLDVAFLSLPVVALYNLITGPSASAD